jgi:hypothetical protein
MAGMVFLMILIRPASEPEAIAVTVLTQTPHFGLR